MEDKLLFKNEWISVFERDGWYTFSHSNHNGLVCIVPYSYKNGIGREILGRFEICPAHLDGMSLTSITGAIEEKEEPIEAAIRELKEEAGYSISDFDMKYLGKVRLTKQCDEICYLFTCDLTNYERGEAFGDGTKGEEGAYCGWITFEEAMNSKEPCMHSILLKLITRYKLLFSYQ